MKITMSSGHGIYVSGANGYLNEVNEARRVVDKVTEYLKELGVSVNKYHDNTSKTQSDNVNGIVAYHNKTSRDLDISVHFNASKTTDKPMGVEVLHFTDSAKELAAKVSKAIAEAAGFKDRGPKKRTDLGFLKRTKQTAILIETCFVDSKADEELYNKYFDEICRTIAEAVSGKKLVKKPIVELVVDNKPTYTSNYHTVKPGDTLWSLAQKYGVSITSLKSLNKLSNDSLKVGQKLLIDNGKYHLGNLEKVRVVKGCYTYTHPAFIDKYRKDYIEDGVFSVSGIVSTSNGTPMLLLKSGLYLTANKSFVEKFI